MAYLRNPCFFALTLGVIRDPKAFASVDGGAGCARGADPEASISNSRDGSRTMAAMRK